MAVLTWDNPQPWDGPQTWDGYLADTGALPPPLALATIGIRSLPGTIAARTKPGSIDAGDTTTSIAVRR